MQGFGGASDRQVSSTTEAREGGGGVVEVSSSD